jgi:energy-coupling factor transport system ATP-binding protein
MSEPIAVLKDVTYMYPRSEAPVLSEINLEIYKGEFLGIIGPTGAGKSTLCLSLNGIVPQFYGGRFFGSILTAGLDTLDHPISALANHVGQVFEDPETQLIATTVENEIAFAMENLKFSRAEIRRRIPIALEAVRLSGTEQKHPHELSGGQKQRLAIAAVIAVQPSILILDEPTSQLDPIGAEEVFRTAYELNQEHGMTVVMASHAAEEMAQYSDRILLLAEGKIVALGTPEEIYSQVDLLLQHEVRPPQVATTFYAMRKRGISVPEIPVKMDRGSSELENLQSNLGSHALTLPGVDAKTGGALLSIKNLKHVYPDGTEALHGVSLDVREGEYLLIIGQNGAGKSTLVKHFLKLLDPTEGQVLIDGAPTEELEMADLARRIGYVAQNPDNQIFNATVEEEISFALKNLDYEEDEVIARTNESLKSMGLEDVRERHPLSLPKGDRARVVIAAILAMQPEIVIFDEPTTGQDYRGAKYILEISKRLHQMGKTVIVITHHLYLMPEYAERVIVMGKGTLLLDADLRQAFHQTSVLESTFLSAPQAVRMAQTIQKIDPNYQNLLTPQELADSFRTVPEGSAA